MRNERSEALFSGFLVKDSWQATEEIFFGEWVDHCLAHALHTVLCLRSHVPLYITQFCGPENVWRPYLIG